MGLAELITRIELRKDGETFHSFNPIAVLLSYLTKAPCAIRHSMCECVVKTACHAREHLPCLRWSCAREQHATRVQVNLCVCAYSMVRRLEARLLTCTGSCGVSIQDLSVFEPWQLFGPWQIPTNSQFDIKHGEETSRVHRVMLGQYSRSECCLDLGKFLGPWQIQRLR